MADSDQGVWDLQQLLRSPNLSPRSGVGGTVLFDLLKQAGYDVKRLTAPDGLRGLDLAGYYNTTNLSADDIAYNSGIADKLGAGSKFGLTPWKDASGKNMATNFITGADGKTLAKMDYEVTESTFDKVFSAAVMAFLGTAFAGAAGFGPMSAGAGATPGAAGAAGTVGSGVEGAFTLPVNPGAVGPASEWASLGSMASGGGGSVASGLSSGFGGGGGSSLGFGTGESLLAGSGGSALAPSTIGLPAVGTTDLVAGAGLTTAMPGFGTSAIVPGGLSTGGLSAVSAAGLGGTALAGGLGAAAGGVAAGKGLTGTINSLLGTSLTGTQMGSIASGIGQLAGGIKGFGDGSDLIEAGQNADAFQPYRAGYAKMLADLMRDPSSVTSLPGYEFGLLESEKALTRNLASQGLTGSGTAAKAIPYNASDYAGKYYQQQIQTLAGLAGANMNNVGTGLAAQSAGMSAQNNSLNALFKLIPAFFQGD